MSFLRPMGSTPPNFGPATYGPPAFGLPGSGMSDPRAIAPLPPAPPTYVPRNIPALPQLVPGPTLVAPPNALYPAYPPNVLYPANPPNVLYPANPRNRNGPDWGQPVGEPKHHSQDEGDSREQQTR